MLKKWLKKPKIVYFISGVICTLTIALLFPYLNHNYLGNKEVIAQGNTAVFRSINHKNLL
jgi:hypothetical protein